MKISIHRAPLGNLAGCSFTGDFRSHRRWATFSTGTPLRIKGGPFTGNYEIIEGGLHEQSIFLYGHSVKGAWRGLHYWGPDVYAEERSGDGHLFS